MNKLSEQQIIDSRFAALYKALSCAAVMSVFLPAVHAVFFGALGLSPIITTLSFAVSFMIGYGLMALYAGVTKLRRRENDLSYEGLIRYFNSKAAMLPFGAAFLLSLAVYGSISAYVRWRYENRVDIYWDPNSLWPLLGMMLFLAVCCVGVVMWFYPYYRICSTKYFVWLMAFLLIDVFICSDQGYVVFCAFMYIVLSLLVLNQNNLILSVIAADSATRGKSASDSDVSPDRLLGRVTVGMRLYNMALVAVLVLLLGVILIGCISAVVGIVTLFRMLLFVVLAALFRDEDTYVGEADEVARQTYREVFEPSFYGMKSHAESETFFWLFILIAVSAIFFFIVVARTGMIKKILNFFRSLYDAVIRFFSALLGGKNDASPEKPAGMTGYVDQEEDIDPDELKRIRGMNEEKLTYRVFLRELNSRKSASEKFSYAYSVMAGLFTENGSGVKKSDTPRQIKEKLVDRDDLPDLGQMTEMYEKINYAGLTPIEDKANKMTGGITAALRRMMGDK